MQRPFRKLESFYCRNDRSDPVSLVQPESTTLHKNRLDLMEESLQQMTEQLAALRTSRNDTR